MTNERNNLDPGAESDERVTATYRDLANERAPERLNTIVLRKAEKAARPPYKRSILWTRPAAWAAVVAICLAITLQVTQVPTPTDMPIATELLRSDSVDDVPDKEEQEQSREEQSRDRQVSKDAPAGRSAEDNTAERRIGTGNQAVETTITPESPAEAALEEAALEEAAPDLVEDFEMQDADMLRRAEDMVRLQAGDNKAREYKEHDQSERGNLAATASGLTTTTAPARFDASGCSARSRQNPEDWLDCILALEDLGLTEEAELQREQLAEAFPDFEIPPRSE